MEALTLVLALVVVAILADRFGEDRRPVHHSTAYQQALTGMILEPRTRPQIVVEPRDYAVTRVMEEIASDLEPTPAALAVQTI